jgi:UDPglucose 6-dehydrogenase
MRDAPSVKIIESLLADGATIVAYDPEAMDEAKKIFGARIQLVGSNYGCVEGADALLIVTEWQALPESEFRAHEGHDAPAGDLRRPEHL